MTKANKTRRKTFEIWGISEVKCWWRHWRRT